MTRFHGHKALTILFFPVAFIGMATASPDPRLLSLIPPGAQLVAGVSASSMQGQPDRYLLITVTNKVDFDDFLALTGADSTRTIHQVVFVATVNDKDIFREHSLLVSGHFDQPRLLRSATGAGAIVTSYRGIQVAEIQPFARERDRFRDVRWLAVLDSSVLVFGSIASTRLELDRYLAHSHPDESLLRRLARLRSKDQTWCVLSASVGNLSSPAREKKIHRALAQVNPELADLALAGNEFEFGLYYGRKVEFEYEVTLASTGEGRVSPDSIRQSPVESVRSSSLLPAPDTSGQANTIHGVFAVSTSRFKAWLAGIGGERDSVH